MKRNILAVILAGGDSSRFWPLKEKIFFPYFGKPLLFYTLNRLQQEGINEFLVIHSKTNYRLLKKFMENYPSFNIKTVEQNDLCGMVGAILSAKEEIKNRNIFIIGAEEVYENFLIQDVFKKITSDVQALIVGYQTPIYMSGGYLEVKNGIVEGILEKPKRGKEPSNIINIVFHYFKEANILIKYLSEAKSHEDDLYEIALDKMMSDGFKFYLHTYKGYWGYLKYPWHVLNLASYFLSTIKGKRGDNIVIDQSAVMYGEIYIEPNVRILENAKIVGPTYIGSNTIIGNSSIVRESMIGQNCVVGFDSEITRSYIGDNCWFHSNYVGDSVIDNNVSMGAGAVLANFRLDEDYIKSELKGEKINTDRIKFGAVIGANSRIGVNASIMPGVKIGSDALVGAGVVLDKDLSDRKFCYLDTRHNKVKNNKIQVSADLRLAVKNKLKLS